MKTECAGNRVVISNANSNAQQVILTNWMKKVSPELLAKLETGDLGPFTGIVSGDHSRIQSLARYYGIQLIPVGDDVATFRNASNHAVRALAASPHVVKVEGSHPVAPETGDFFG